MATSRRDRAATEGPVSAERIEAAAIKLFSEKSYPVVGMRDISEAVGILPGSLYVHIKSKEDILFGIVERGIRNYLSVIEDLVTSGLPAPQILRGVIVAYMRVLARTMPETKIAFDQWTYLSPPQRDQVIQLRRRYQDLFSQVITQGMEAQQFPAVRNPRIAVLAIIGMLNSATEWFSPDGDLDATEVGHLLADSALSGLGVTPA